MAVDLVVSCYTGYVESSRPEKSNKSWVYGISQNSESSSAEVRQDMIRRPSATPRDLVSTKQGIWRHIGSKVSGPAGILKHRACHLTNVTNSG